MPGYQYDVAVSFAGEDRELVEQIVTQLTQSGLGIFYDTNYQADMWGEDLIEYLDDVYRHKARYVMMSFPASMPRRCGPVTNAVAHWRVR